MEARSAVPNRASAGRERKLEYFTQELRLPTVFDPGLTLRREKTGSFGLYSKTYCREQPCCKDTPSQANRQRLGSKDAQSRGASLQLPLSAEAGLLKPFLFKTIDTMAQVPLSSRC